MARLKGNNLQNPFTGKLGGLVGCKWKNTYYIRTRPITVKHPNTVKQLAQRMRFTKTQQFLKPLKDFLHLGYGAYTADMSAFNAAMSYNLRNALAGDYPDINVDSSLAMVSRGTLPVPSWAEVTLLEGNKLLFSWDQNFPKGLFCSNDKVLVVLRHLQEHHSSYRLDVTQRSAGTVMTDIDFYYNSGDVACYLVFVKQKLLLGECAEENISNSIYCGTISRNTE